MPSFWGMIAEIRNHIPLSNHMKNILSVVDRGLFIPFYARHFIYSLDAIYLGNGRWIQSPLTAVKMAQYLELRKRDKVLEIGCSSGYQATILSKLCDQVFTIDCDPIILQKAQKSFDALKIDNIYPILALEEKDWVSKETFDRIIFSFSVKKVPSIYFSRLAENGIIIVPLEESGMQYITKYHKKNGTITIERIEICQFVSMPEFNCI